MLEGGFNDGQSESSQTIKSTCQLPYLDDNLKEDKIKYSFDCEDDDNLVHVKNGKFYINFVDRYQCFYQKLLRINDFKTILDKQLVYFTSGEAIPHDYLKITCLLKELGNYTTQILAIAPKTNIAKERRNAIPNESALNYNVAIIGFDSTSRISFKKHMPLSYRTFIDDLNGIVFKKHNIIGDGTTANLLGMLTGKNENELPEARKRMPNAKPVDSYPWIYQFYKRAGYITLHAEDHAKFGTFQYRLMGFNQTPTDHYARPYYVYDDRVYLCRGKTTAHKIIFDLLYEMYGVYEPNSKKLSFIFQAESSHDDNYYMTPGDNYFSKLLMEFNPGGKFDDTILFLISDHGNRYSKDRSNAQGKYEERLPIFGIHLPLKLKTERPDIFENIKRNSEMLTSQRDVYATLLHILGLPKEKNQPYLSLFDPIPNTRTCKDAAINTHWCVCNIWKSLDPSHEHGQLAVKATIDTINRYTNSLRSLCAPLQIKLISSVQEHSKNREVLAYAKSKDLDGLVPDLTDNVTSSQVFYQVAFIASPGDAKFESTVEMDLSTEMFSVRETEISRTSMYKDWIKCLPLDYPELRRFCICKDAVAKNKM